MLIETNTAKLFVDTFFADPVLKLAGKAILNNAPAAAALSLNDVKVYLQKKLVEWEALGDRALEPANVWGHNFIVACLDDLRAYEESGNSVRDCPKMVVTQTMEGFSNEEAAAARGWYRKRYFCPVCKLEVADEMCEGDRVFGSGSVLKTNQLPRFCPDCGAPLVRPDKSKEDGR